MSPAIMIGINILNAQQPETVTSYSRSVSSKKMEATTYEKTSSTLETLDYVYDSEDDSVDNNANNTRGFPTKNHYDSDYKQKKCESFDSRKRAFSPKKDKHSVTQKRVKYESVLSEYKMNYAKV